MNMFSEGGKTMNRHNKHLKDPGSAITHFIGMLMAIFAAVPLLIKAAREPDHIYLISLTIYALSLFYCMRQAPLIILLTYRRRPIRF